MAALMTQSNFAPASELGRSLADRVLTLTAMGGAVSGAVGGAVWAGDPGVLSVLFGTLGTMFGSGLAAGAGVLAVRPWAHAAAEVDHDRAETCDAAPADVVAAR